MAFTYFKTPPEKRRASRGMLILFLVSVFLGLCALVVYLRIAPTAEASGGEPASVRFRSPESTVSYGQVSVDYSNSAAFSKTDVYSRRASITSILEQNSVTPETERGRLYVDCYSGETSASVRTERASCSVTLMTVGGDFFFFHPLTLCSGWYLPTDEELVMTVVLDEYAAWQLFGATDVAGLNVELGDQVYTVCGVVRRPDDPAAREAYGDTPRVFIHETGYMLAGYEPRFTSYEILMPDPIKNFAVSQTKTALGVNETNPDVVVRDEQLRFHLDTLLSDTKGFFLRVMRRDTVLFPFWENAALVAESKCIVLALLFTVLASLAGVCLFVSIVLWFRIHPVTLKGIWGFFDAKIDHRRAVRYRKKEREREKKQAGE